MERIVNLTKEKRKILFESAARELKVSSTIIEKDFWVCYVLNYLMNVSKFKDCFIFKGGTSLSKCYNVIKRFSEDVDLILKWDKIGFDDEEVYKNRSKNQDYKFEVLMNEKGAYFIQNEFKKDLIENFANKIEDVEIVSDANDPMVLFVKYPTGYKDEYILSSVKLEIGPVAAKTPVEIEHIEPYCFKSFNADNKYPFNVVTVTIARTFWEKLLILHAECNRPQDKRTPMRYSRHYYDVFMMHKSSFFRSILNDKFLFEEVKAFKSKYYRTAWSNLDDCSLENIRLVPSNERIKELSQDYSKMKDMIFDNAPPFEEIIFNIGLLEEELHEINNDKIHYIEN